MTKPKSAYRNEPSSGSRLTTAAVCARYNISPSTLARWLNNPALEFPRPLQMVPHGTHLYNAAELEAFDRRRVAIAPPTRQQLIEAIRASLELSITIANLKPHRLALQTLLTVLESPNCMIRFDS